MNYIDYHNAQADLFAQRYYGLTYDALTPFMQMIIDDQVAVEWMDKDLQK